ncbi:hypothetical protein ACWCPM_07790 [Streptomyces sp. NPDC002309]
MAGPRRNLSKPSSMRRPYLPTPLLQMLEALSGGVPRQGETVPAWSRIAGLRRGGVATIAAHGVACLVHFLTAGMLIGGLLLTVFGWSTVVLPLIGMLLLGAAGRLFPRLGGLDRDLPVLTREDAPALYALLDAIADAVGVRRLEAVQVSAEFALRISTYGIRGKRRLELGLPLWLTFALQQRVAVAAHEMAHFVSGDIRRGVLVGAALSSLGDRSPLTERRPGTVSAILRTSVSPGSRHADEMAAASVRFDRQRRLTHGALWIPALMVKGTRSLLMRLTLPGVRRAEFQADTVAARTASTQAAVAAARDQLLAGIVNAEVHRLAVARRTFGRADAARRTDQEFWTEVAAFAAALPDGVREGIDGVHHCDGTRTIPDAPSGPVQDDGLGLPRVSVRIRRLSLGEAAAHTGTVTLDADAADSISDELREPARLLAGKAVQDCVS